MTPLFLGLSALLASSSTTTKQRQDDSDIRLFIGGLGYCGFRIAAAFHDAYGGQDGCGVTISGTVRSSERRDALLSSPPAWLAPDHTADDDDGVGGGSIHVLDLDDQYAGLSPDGLADLRRATHVIQTVAPIADFDRDPLLALHGDVLRNSKHLRYVGYISSTGVYGDYDGDWVNEESSELKCVDVKSLARVVAEREWGELETDDIDDDDDDSKGTKGVTKGPRVDCFRCGGIYGPGRGPLFSSVTTLEAALDSGEEETAAVPKYVNRIVVDDICGALLAATDGERPRFKGLGRAYNLVDDDPAPRREVVKEARRLLAAAAALDGGASAGGPAEAGTAATVASKPGSAKTAARKRRVSRSTGNKRCENARLKEEYGWEPAAPTYREGLALLLKQQRGL